MHTVDTYRTYYRVVVSTWTCKVRAFTSLEVEEIVITVQYRHYGISRVCSAVCSVQFSRCSLIVHRRWLEGNNNNGQWAKGNG